jgi:hypothetical protein
MALQTITGKPSHPIPEDVRKRIHDRLDELLNEYEWDRLPLQSMYAWEHPKSGGEISLRVRRSFSF